MMGKPIVSDGFPIAIMVDGPGAPGRRGAIVADGRPLVPDWMPCPSCRGGALAAFLRDRAVGQVVARADLAAISALKTFQPPLHSVQGLEVTGASRHGKFLDLDVSGLHLVVHLARGGWLHWRDALPPAPPRPGKNPLAFRLRLADDSGFDLTEQGTKKGLAIYLVRDPAEVPGVARLGPDALALSRDELGKILGAQRGQIKGVLTHQSVIAGIGNAYSDEILHAAKLSRSR